MSHRRCAEQTFNGDVKFSGVPFRHNLIVIAFSNRSGSNYFCDLLNASGQLPMGEEFLNDEEMLADPYRAKSFDSYLRQVAETHARNGYFVTKAGREQLQMLKDWGYLDAGAFPSVSFALCMREDAVAQAVSFSIADQTKRWTSEDQSNGVEPVFNPDDIRNRLRGAEADRAAILEFFSKEEYRHFPVRYEQLMKSPGLVVAGFGEFIGLPLKFNPQGVQLKRQATRRNELWKHRFQSIESGASLMGYHTLPGWLLEPAALFTTALYEAFGSSDLKGPAFEIGVYRGKYLSVIVESCKRHSIAAPIVGYDIFSYNQQQVVADDFRWLYDHDIKLVTCDSMQLSRETILQDIGAPAHMVSIDGSHEANYVANDLTLVAQCLAQAGIVAIDDFINPVALGVGEGVYRVMLGNSPPDLVPFAYIYNKLFMCRASAYERYFTWSLGFMERNIAEPWMKVIQDKRVRGAPLTVNLFGRPVLTIHN